MFALLCLVTMVMLSSCSKEKDNDDLIVGKWKIIESTRKEGYTKFHFNGITGDFTKKNKYLGLFTFKYWLHIFIASIHMFLDLYSPANNAIFLVSSGSSLTLVSNKSK